MAAAFSSLVGQPRAILSASPTVSFSQIRKPANFPLQNSRGFMVNSSSFPRTCTMAMVRDENVDPSRNDSSINWPSNDDPKVVDVPGLQERDFTGTPYIPVYVMLPVVMSFHECGGNVGDDVHIPLPRWVREIGYTNPDIFFTDKDLRGTHECLAWGVDNERVLGGRIALECYDKYLFNSLKKATKAVGCSSCGKIPLECSGILKFLIDHGDQVLGLASLSFKGIPIAAKQLPGIYWWRNTRSGAAELTAGFYSFYCRGGYSTVASMLKKHEAALNFTCLELQTVYRDIVFPDASLADPEGLVWEVLNVAWDAYIPVAGENARPCYHREGYNKILENAKPRNDPVGRYHLSAFTYLRLSQTLLEKHNFMEFERFVQKMHGVQCNYLSWSHVWNLE